MAFDNLLTILPIRSTSPTSSSGNAFISAFTKTVNPNANSAPLTICSGESLPASLHTKTMMTMAAANLISILPIFSTLLRSPIFTEVVLMAAAKTAKITIIVIMDRKPCSICDCSILPSILIDTASIAITAATESKLF